MQEKQEQAEIDTKKPAENFTESHDDDKEITAMPIEDIKKVTATTAEIQETTTEIVKDVTKFEVKNETSTEKLGFSPGELDLGTGSPDPTMIDMFYTPTTTEVGDIVDRSDGFSIMDYFFGVTSPDSDEGGNSEKYEEKTDQVKEEPATDSPAEIMKAEETKPRQATTESSFIPDEFTSTVSDETTESTASEFGEKLPETTKVNEVVTEKSEAVESTSVSSFMDPNNVISTSMSTEISHETEICFRGKCIKTNKDIL